MSIVRAACFSRRHPPPPLVGLAPCVRNRCAAPDEHVSARVPGRPPDTAAAATSRTHARLQERTNARGRRRTLGRKRDEWHSGESRGGDTRTRARAPQVAPALATRGPTPPRPRALQLTDRRRRGGLPSVAACASDGAAAKEGGRCHRPTRSVWRVKWVEGGPRHGGGGGAGSLWRPTVLRGGSTAPRWRHRGGGAGSAAAAAVARLTLSGSAANVAAVSASAGRRRAGGPGGVADVSSGLQAQALLLRIAPRRLRVGADTPMYSSYPSPAESLPSRSRYSEDGLSSSLWFVLLSTPSPQ